ncbi:MAG: hypothetical protein ACI84R_003463 [Candidatus Azotimanducaceae bacterium]|jgi:hypothetical protein
MSDLIIKVLVVQQLTQSQKMLHDVSGTALTSQSNDRFLGKEEQEITFKLTLKRQCPKLCIVDVGGERIFHHDTSRFLNRAAVCSDHLCVVYWMGG